MRRMLSDQPVADSVVPSREIAMARLPDALAPGWLRIEGCVYEGDSMQALAPAVVS
jgi:hypothetical protein